MPKKKGRGNKFADDSDEDVPSMITAGELMEKTVKPAKKGGAAKKKPDKKGALKKNLLVEDDDDGDDIDEIEINEEPKKEEVKEAKKGEYDFDFCVHL